MNKKFYEAPSQEIVELEVATALLVGSNGSNADNVDSETPDWE